MTDAPFVIAAYTIVIGGLAVYARSVLGRLRAARARAAWLALPPERPAMASTLSGARDETS